MGGFVDQTLVELTAIGVTFAVGHFGTWQQAAQFIKRNVHLGRVDARTATTLEVRVLRRTSDDGNTAGVFQRQDAVVLKQHHPLASDFACQGVMRSLIVRTALRRLRRLEDDLQQTTHRLV